MTTAWAAQAQDRLSIEEREALNDKHPGWTLLADQVLRGDFDGNELNDAVVQILYPDSTRADGWQSRLIAILHKPDSLVVSRGYPASARWPYRLRLVGEGSTQCYYHTDWGTSPRRWCWKPGHDFVRLGRDSLSSSALVAWHGNGDPTQVMGEDSTEALMITYERRDRAYWTSRHEKDLERCAATFGTDDLESSAKTIDDGLNLVLLNRIDSTAAVHGFEAPDRRRHVSFPGVRGDKRPEVLAILGREGTTDGGYVAACVDNRCDMIQIEEFTPAMIRFTDSLLAVGRELPYWTPPRWEDCRFARGQTRKENAFFVACGCTLYQFEWDSGLIYRGGVRQPGIDY